MSPNQAVQAGVIFLSDESVAGARSDERGGQQGLFPKTRAGQMLTQPVKQRAQPSRALVHDEREWAQNNATCDCPQPDGQASKRKRHMEQPLSHTLAFKSQAR